MNFVTYFIYLSCRRGRGGSGRSGWLLSVGDGERDVCGGRWRHHPRDVSALWSHEGRQVRARGLLYRLRGGRAAGTGETLLRLEAMFRSGVWSAAVPSPAVQEGPSRLPGAGLPLRFRCDGRLRLWLNGIVFHKKTHPRATERHLLYGITQQLNTGERSPP